MVFETDEEAKVYINKHKKESKLITVARAQHKELTALVEGDGFDEELINKIEHIESDEKALARKKYSRNIVDLFERILLPISNVFSSTGGSKKYNITEGTITENFLKLISNVRGGKTIQQYIEETALQLFHIDPNGVIFMEYDSDKWIKPTYKSINSIQAYEVNGQQLGVILFTPKTTSEGQLWRIVDDIMDRTFIESGGHLTLVEDLTFKHTFGEVPGVVISNIEKVNAPIKLSPISKIVPISREYARDQSVKTLYKFLHAFPIFWKYVTQCQTCTGTGKDGTKKCKGCDGHGFYKKKDVTDIVTLPVPKGEQVKLAPDIAGYISPDLETWRQYNNELELLEKLANKTIWGSFMVEGKNETATGRWIDVQPVINKLNKYADWAEFMEFKISEWMYRYLVGGSEDTISMIAYGRRYMLDSPDIILANYQKAKTDGSNNSILDKLLNEYITSKYKNDPLWLRDELLKSAVEPHIHLSIESVKSNFGDLEAQKKSMFSQWWNDLEDKDKDQSAKELREKYNEEFIINFKPINITPNE